MSGQAAGINNDILTEKSGHTEGAGVHEVPEPVSGVEARTRSGNDLREETPKNIREQLEEQRRDGDDLRAELLENSE